MRAVWLVLSVTGLILLNGCATVFKGTSSNIQLWSEPPGAKVYVDGFPVGTTPTKLKLESKKSYHVEFKKDGYENANYLLTNHVSVGWLVVDILFGFVPILVDALTGSWYGLDQDAFRVNLEKIGERISESALPAAPTSVISGEEITPPFGLQWGLGYKEAKSAVENSPTGSGWRSGAGLNIGKLESTAEYGSQFSVAVITRAVILFRESDRAVVVFDPDEKLCGIDMKVSFSRDYDKCLQFYKALCSSLSDRYGANYRSLVAESGDQPNLAQDLWRDQLDHVAVVEMSQERIQYANRYSVRYLVAGPSLRLDANDPRP